MPRNLEKRSKLYGRLPDGTEVEIIIKPKRRLKPVIPIFGPEGGSIPAHLEPRFGPGGPTFWTWPGLFKS